MIRAGLLSVVFLLAGIAGAQDAAPLAQRGERVFWTQGCYGCHTVRNAGTPMAPDLSRIGARYSRSYFERWLADPEAVRPAAHMPKLELSASDVEALAAYLATLR